MKWSTANSRKRKAERRTAWPRMFIVRGGQVAFVVSPDNERWNAMYCDALSPPASPSDTP